MATSMEPSAAPNARSASANVRGVPAIDQQGQNQCEADPACDDDRLGAMACAQNAGREHRDDRADAEAEQQQAKDRVIDREPLLRERHQRRPAGKAEAGDQEREARGEPRRRPVG